MRYWLLNKRLEMDLRQCDIARKCGITQSAYSLIETGKGTPCVRTAKAIANFVGENWVKFYDDELSEERKVFVMVKRVRRLRGPCRRKAVRV